MQSLTAHGCRFKKHRQNTSALVCWQCSVYNKKDSHFKLERFSADGMVDVGENVIREVFTVVEVGKILDKLTQCHLLPGILTSHQSYHTVNVGCVAFLFLVRYKTEAENKK